MAVSKVTYVQDFPELAQLSASDRSQALNEIGNYYVEAILADVGEARSPVTGRAFKKLSTAYAAFKAHQSSAPIPNLELSGDMLDALTFKINGTRVEVGIFGDEAPKADGHNNHSGKSKLPERKFIPDKGEQFRPDIRQEVQSILESYAPEPNQVRAFRSKVR